jgi:SAM-dependent methyltransferase
VSPRRFAQRLERLPFAVPLTAALADYRAKRWLKRNPGRTFADYYVALNEARIDSGRPHPTLGKAGYSSGAKRATKWTTDSFRERGRDQWSVFREHGLEPWMRTVDYGCGSLRLGQHAIEYLDPQRYCGIDPSQHFIDAGLALLDPAMVAAKLPWVGGLDDQTIDRIHEWKPQFIFSNAVLQHVPPADLPTYFERLDRMMTPGCVAIIMFPCATTEKRIKATSWAYPQAQLERIAKRVAADIEVEFAALPKGRERLSGGGRRLMILRRLDSATSGVQA